MSKTLKNVGCIGVFKKEAVACLVGGPLDGKEMEIDWCLAIEALEPIEYDVLMYALGYYQKTHILHRWKRGDLSPDNKWFFIYEGVVDDDD